MITMSEKMDEHLTTTGKRVRWPANEAAARAAGRHVEIACVGSETWEVRAQWLTGESYSSDPESVNCGCPLQGRNHAEVIRTVSSLTEAWGLWEQARRELQGGDRATCLGNAKLI